MKLLYVINIVVNFTLLNFLIKTYLLYNMLQINNIGRDKVPAQ